MMLLNTLLMAASPLLAIAPAQPDIVAVKVERAETVSDGTLQHAVILIEDGKIAVIGEDLPIERGIRVIDLGPGSVAMPGLVNAYSRQGMDSRGSNDSKPGLRASSELYPAFRDYGELLEAGITTLGLYPAGNGIPGRALAIKPQGKTAEEMTLADDVYLKIILRANARSKKMIRHGFEEADDYIEEEAKARAKWEKAKEKADKAKKKKKKKKSKDNDKDDDKDEADGKAGVNGKTDATAKKELGLYVAPAPKPEAQTFQSLRDRDLHALISIGSAQDYLHMIDAIGEEEFDWDLRIRVLQSLNIFHVKRELGKLGCRVVMEPSLSLHPNTRRLRNLPMELSQEGAKIVLIPRSDDLTAQRDWLHNTGELIGAGLSREVALRAMTLEPAGLLGLDERLGSLSVGKDANILFFRADPFEPGTQVEAVMLEGEIVYGEIN